MSFSLSTPDLMRLREPPSLTTPSPLLINHCRLKRKQEISESSTVFGDLTLGTPSTHSSTSTSLSSRNSFHPSCLLPFFFSSSLCLLPLPSPFSAPRGSVFSYSLCFFYLTPQRSPFSNFGPYSFLLFLVH